jgi:Xaa-Pro aminopeptidase
VLSQRDQARVIDEILRERIKTVLPVVMRREGIDMWVLIAREYNEDPVLKTFLPAEWMSARRTTMLLLYDPGPGHDIECLAVSRYKVGDLFKAAWNTDVNPDQWVQLTKLIEERNPRKIGINKSEHFGLADGLSAFHEEKLVSMLNKKMAAAVVSAEKLALAWLETRSEHEMALYPRICELSHSIIKEGFSSKVIHPGVTTTEDVEWWFRERIRELKLDTWFHPTVSVQRNEPEESFKKRAQPLTILPGDLLHVDIGITYLRLNTDMQQHAYVLKSNESSAPEYLVKALARANKVQDILTRNITNDKTGNQILSTARAEAQAQGLSPTLYTHPIGLHGHGAGTHIGMWDMQQGIPFVGEYPVHFNTAYSIELSSSVYVIEWKKEVSIMLEEEGYYDNKGFRYLDGRQTELILIR